MAATVLAGTGASQLAPARVGGRFTRFAGPVVVADLAVGFRSGEAS